MLKSQEDITREVQTKILYEHKCKHLFIFKIFVQVLLSPFYPQLPSTHPHLLPSFLSLLAVFMCPFYMFLDDPSPIFPHYPSPPSPLLTTSLLFMLMTLFIVSLLICSVGSFNHINHINY